MKFDKGIVIGLEIHVELDTATKLFCSCPAHGSDEPNTRTCPVCLGHPGSKPVLNGKAFMFALKLCLAAGCTIASELIFSRKSYFYPDLAKNYQITQYEQPLGKDGMIRLGSGKEIGITRIHLEEDPASLVHESGIAGSNYVLVDYNRSGTPLAELVTKPELNSPEEARDFMKQLIILLKYLKIYDPESTIKADANISIKESGYTRVEIKNINGFKEIERALRYEITRQIHEIKEGRNVVHETRAWDSAVGKTISLRSKETDEEYGYIIDPDLAAIEVTGDIIKKVKEDIPELAEDKEKKYIREYKIGKTDARILSADLHLAELFEKVIKEIDPISASKWLRHELLRVLNLKNIGLENMKISERHIIDLLTLIREKKISDKVAVEILETIVETPEMPSDYVKRKDLASVDADSMARLCQKAIKENPVPVNDYKSGKEWAINFLVGKVMKASQGKAIPQDVKDKLKDMLKDGGVL